MTLVAKTPPIKYANADTTALVNFANDQARNVKEASYGALGNDTGNDAPAIQAAINDVPATRGGAVYIPPGTYRVTSPIVFPTDRQVRLMGAGPQATILHVTSGTTATPGVIHMQGIDCRSSVEQLQIAFDQPDTATRTAMTHYVPAIYVNNVPRFQIRHIRMVRAWIGIDMRGNSVGEIEDVEISHFDTGIWIDGALDANRITHFHDWPFALTANQQLANADTANTGLRIGRADTVHLSNSLFHCGMGIRTFPGAGGAAVLHVTNCGFDTYGGVNLTAGNVRIGDSSFGTRSATGYIALAVTGATDGNVVQVANCFFLTDTGTVPVVDIRGAAGAGYMAINITGCQFETFAGNQSAIIADGTLGGVIHATIVDNHFSRAANIAYTAPTIGLGANVRAAIVNNTTRDKGTGAANFLAAVGSNAVVDGNILLGWGLNYGAGAVAMGSNNLSALLSGAGRESITTIGFMQASGLLPLDASLSPPIAVRRYAGNLDGAGASIFAHALGSLQQTGLNVQAWFKTALGAMNPLTVVAVDSTNIHVTGGIAGAAFRCTVLYSSNAHVW